MHEINFDAEPRTRSIAELQEKIRERAKTKPKGEWILGSQVRDENYVEKRYPTRWELDEAAPEHPILIRGSGSHIVCANSLALELAGITRDTVDPPGGSIDRDEQGEPNGILRERGKLGLTLGETNSVIPDYTFEQYVEALEVIGRDVLGPSGITSICAMTVSPQEVRAHQVALKQDRFPVRTNLLLRVIESNFTLEDLATIGLENGYGNDSLKIGGVKVSIDGGSLQRNASMYHDYPGEPGNKGLIRIPQPELDDSVTTADQMGLRNVIHSIGDHAYDMALSAVEDGVDLTRDHRTRIEHLGNLPITNEQIQKALELGVVASPQPQFIWTYGDKWIDIFGREAMEKAFPFRTMLDAGLTVIGNSDFGMSPINPLVGVQAAVTRKTQNGVVLGADQSISVYEALELYTSNAAWSDFDENKRGVIKPGMLADLTVLAAHPDDVDPDTIGEIKVLKTIIGGNAYFEQDM